MLGWSLVASENSPATNLLDSPSHLFILEPTINRLYHDIVIESTYKLDNGKLMKVASLSFANAFAIIVFPQPGCP
jgi:hypothetical protein